MFDKIKKMIKRSLNKELIRDLQSRKNGVEMRLEGMRQKLKFDEEALSVFEKNIKVGPAVRPTDWLNSYEKFCSDIEIDKSEIRELEQELEGLNEALLEFE